MCKKYNVHAAVIQLKEKKKIMYLSTERPSTVRVCMTNK